MKRDFGSEGALEGRPTPVEARIARPFPSQTSVKLFAKPRDVTAESPTDVELDPLLHDRITIM